jgi:hypothetical protein
MSHRYQRTTRRQRHARYARQKKERIHTGLGHFYNVLRFFGLAWLTKQLMRKPWHVADLYLDGAFLQHIYMYPAESTAQRLARIERMAQEKAKKVSGPKPEHGKA